MKNIEILISEVKERLAEIENILDGRVLIITSEDGVPLYHGDNYHRASRVNGSAPWNYSYCVNLDKYHSVATCPVNGKAFYTQEAAEAWISEKNYTGEAYVDLGDGCSARLTRGIAVLCVDGITISITPAAINQIHQALKTLK